MADHHWRNTMRPARFFMMDARAAFPFLLCLLHMRLYTLVPAAIITLLFWIVEQRGYTFDAAVRFLRTWLVIPNRPAVLFTKRRYLVDYGAVDYETAQAKPAAAKAAKIMGRAKAKLAPKKS